MVSIIIYTTPSILLHKQGKLENDQDKSDFNEYYWMLSKSPKRLTIKDRIYFAVRGYIRGYFEIIDIDDGCIDFDCRTWKDIKPILTKSFQGFKYADKVEELGEK